MFLKNKNFNSWNTLLITFYKTISQTSFFCFINFMVNFFYLKRFYNLTSYTQLYGFQLLLKHKKRENLRHLKTLKSWRIHIRHMRRYYASQFKKTKSTTILKQSKVPIISFIKSARNSSNFLREQASFNQLHPLFNRFFITSRAKIFILKFWFLKNYKQHSRGLLKKNLHSAALSYLQPNANAFNLVFFKGNLKKTVNNKNFVFNIKSFFLKILQQARKLHWVYADYKVCREHSYKRFLQKEIKYFYAKNTTNVSLFNFFYYNFFIFNWLDWLLLIKLNLIYINGTTLTLNQNLQRGDLVEFFTGNGVTPYFNIIKFFYLLKKKKIKKWYFQQTLYKAKPWLRRKKNLPKLTTQLQPQLKVLHNSFQYDTLTGAFLFLQKPKFGYLNPTWLIRYTKVLKLYSWRYRAE